MRQQLGLERDGFFDTEEVPHAHAVQCLAARIYTAYPGVGKTRSQAVL